MKDFISIDFILYVESKINSEKVLLSEEKSADLSELISIVLRQDFAITHQSPSYNTLYYGSSADSSLEVLLTTATYLEIQKMNNYKNLLLDFKLYNIFLTEVEFDIIQKSWILALYSISSKKVSLSDCIDNLNSFNYKLTLELILKIVLEAIEFANLIYKKTQFIGFIMPQYVYFLIKDSKIANTLPSAELKFEFFSQEFVLKNPKFTEIYPATYVHSFRGFYWSLGVIIYSCITATKFEDLPKFAKLESNQISEILDKLNYIPCITEFLKSLFQSFNMDLDAVISLSIYQTWSNLLGTICRPEKIIPNAFCTVFYFENKEIVFKNLCTLASWETLIQELKKEMYFKYDVYKQILSSLCRLPDISIELIKFVLKFLVIIKTKNLICENYYFLICRIVKIKLEFSDDEFRGFLISYLEDLLNDSTQTTNFIFYNEGWLYLLFDKYSQDCLKLFPYISSLGAKSIDLIIFFRKTDKLLDVVKSIKYIKSIPIHFKLQKTSLILEELDYYMKMKLNCGVVTKVTIKAIRLVYLIIYELIKAAKDAKHSNRIGVCYNNYSRYKVVPTMIKCKTCNKVYCIVCGEKHQKLGHNNYFLTHNRLTNKSLFCCGSASYKNEPGSHQNFNFDLDTALVHPSRNSVPKIETIDLDNPIVEGNSYLYHIKSLEISHDTTNNLFYTEFLIEKCETEDLVLEISGTGIKYQNLARACMTNNFFMFPVPRLGVSDTLGVGITNDGCAFFTYNGFNLGNYIKFEDKSIDILLYINNFSKPIITENKLYTEEKYEYLDFNKLEQYENILSSFFSSARIKEKIFKKKTPDYQKLVSVIEDLSKVLDSNDFTNGISSPRKIGIRKSDCRFF